MSETKLNSLSELSSIKIKEDDKVDNNQSKKEYQEKWVANKFIFREMIADKNRKWLKRESEEKEFERHSEFRKSHKEMYRNVYHAIEQMFDVEHKRKYMIHIISNFIPINKTQQVPKLPKDKNICPFSGRKLTDLRTIATGDRDKDIGYTGQNTNVILSGVALQELERFVYYYVENFDTRNGHIINFALDKIRSENK